MKKVWNNEVIKSSAKPWSRLILTLIFVVVAIIAVLLATPAYAKKFGFTIPWPDFDLVGTISSDGLHVVLTAKFEGCTPEQAKWEIQAAITQEPTKAAGLGTAQCICSDDISTIVIDATAQEGSLTFGIPFEEGTAFVEGLGVIRGKHGSNIKETDNWIQFITLVKE